MIDLRKHFRHLHWRPMPHAFGILVASDFADRPEDDPVFGLYKNCGLWTMTEADLIYRCAKQLGNGTALDIGCHSGWTTAHIAAGGLDVIAVDPMLRVQGFQDRFEENMREYWDAVIYTSYLTSDRFFVDIDRKTRFNLCCIDGDHDPPCPINDAKNAAPHLADTGVILLHDALGRPVIDAANWLMDNGFRCAMYTTAHCVAVCYRGDFVPPHLDPEACLAEHNLPARMDGLYRERVSWNGA